MRQKFREMQQHMENQMNQSNPTQNPESSRQNQNPEASKGDYIEFEEIKEKYGVSSTKYKAGFWMWKSDP